MSRGAARSLIRLKAPGGFTYEQLAESILKPLAELQVSPVVFLVLLSAIMIVAGTFLDGIAMIFIIVPLFFPAIELLGIHPVHFGMVVVLCWGIGQQTPPVGAALFITSAIAKVDMLSLSLYRNVHVFSDGKLDRSPGGTGTSMMMAYFERRGAMKIGDVIRSEGLLGIGRFEGQLLDETKLGDVRAVIPTVKGTAKVTGYAKWLIDETDPVGRGFVVT